MTKIHDLPKGNAFEKQFASIFICVLFVLSGGSVHAESVVELLVSNTDGSFENGGEQDVLRFDADSGSFLGRYNVDLSGAYDRPAGLAVDENANILVAANCATACTDGNGRILRFAPLDYNQPQSVVSSFLPLLIGTDGIALDGDGILYVSNQVAGTVEAYDSVTGNHLGTILDRSRVTHDFSTADPLGLTVGPDGSVYVIYTEVDAVVRVEPGPEGSSTVSTTPIPGLALTATSAGLAFGPDGALYLSNPGNSKILRIEVDDSGALGDVGVFVSSGAGGLDKPVGLTFSPNDGQLYVVSQGTNSILVYDGKSGVFLDEFVAPGSGGLNKPSFLNFVGYEIPDLFLLSPANGGIADKSLLLKWQPSSNPRVARYRVLIDVERDGVPVDVPPLPLTSVPQLAIDQSYQLQQFDRVILRVEALDAFGNVLATGEIASLLIGDLPGTMTTISGLVQSNLNSAAITSATVSVTSGANIPPNEGQADAAGPTAPDGGFQILANDTGDFPIQVTVAREGYASRMQEITAADIESTSQTANTGVIGLEPLQRISTLHSATLPTSRSIRVGESASFFASILNAGAQTATECRLEPKPDSAPAGVVFTYQTTNPATNAIDGRINVAADITPSSPNALGLKTYLFAFQPTQPFAPKEIQFRYYCGNVENDAVTLPLVNTVILSADVQPVPDIVAIAGTLGNNGYADIHGEQGTGLFVVATSNLGTADTITVTVDTTVSLPVEVDLCETNPATGTCISARGSSVTTAVASGSTPTFGIFLQGRGIVSDDPAQHRVIVRFTDSQGVLRGATSVAIRTR